MRSRARFDASATVVILVLACFAGAHAPLSAQDAPAGDAPAGDSAAVDSALLDAGQNAAAQAPDLGTADEPPPSWDSLERARSRECVPILARLEAVDSELAPKRQRMQRIEALHEAVTVEDSLRVSPLDRDDPLERAVAEWFRADLELANRYLETEDEAIREERQAAREQMLQRLEDAHQEVNDEAAAILEANRELEAGLQRCQDRIFIRSAVLEACGGDGDPVCEAARAEEREREQEPEQTQEQDSPFRFVDDAVELWNIEQLRPWTEPTPIRPTPRGELAGARTATRTRRGNARVVVGLEPTIQARSELSEEDVARFEEHLDSLGIEFEHPDLVMAPALTFEIDMPGRLGEETHYLLHFGDLSTPELDVVHPVPVPDEWPVRGFFLPSEQTLVRLARGEALALTAVRIEEPGSPGTPVFSMGLTPVLQAQRITTLLQYIMEGELESDLTTLVSSEEEGEAQEQGAAPQ